MQTASFEDFFALLSSILCPMFLIWNIDKAYIKQHTHHHSN